MRVSYSSLMVSGYYHSPVWGASWWLSVWRSLDASVPAADVVATVGAHFGWGIVGRGLAHTLLRGVPGAASRLLVGFAHPVRGYRPTEPGYSAAQELDVALGRGAVADVSYALETLAAVCGGEEARKQEIARQLPIHLALLAAGGGV